MVESEEARLRVTLHYSGPVTLNSLERDFGKLKRLAVGAVALEQTTRDASPDEQRFVSHMVGVDAYPEAHVQVTRLGMESPLWLEMLFGSGGATSAALFFRWLVTHSEDVGAAVPKAVKAWRREWGEVHRLSAEAMTLPATVTEIES